MSRARCRLHAWAGKFLGQFPEAVIILSLPSTVPLPGPQPPAPCCYGKGCVLPGRYPPPAVAMATVSLPSLPSVATETVARSPFHPPPPPPCCRGDGGGRSFVEAAAAVATATRSSPLLWQQPRSSPSCPVAMATASFPPHPTPPPPKNKKEKKKEVPRGRTPLVDAARGWLGGP